MVYSNPFHTMPKNTKILLHSKVIFEESGRNFPISVIQPFSVSSVTYYKNPFF